MGADLFVFTEQWDFPVKACSLLSQALLTWSLETRVTTLQPQRPGVSQFLPSARSDPMCRHQLSPWVPSNDDPRELSVPAAPRIPLCREWGMCSSPQGVSGSFRQISSGPQLGPPAHRTDKQQGSYFCLTSNNHQFSVLVAPWFSWGFFYSSTRINPFALNPSWDVSWECEGKSDSVPDERWLYCGLEQTDWGSEGRGQRCTGK